jgi:hypothetical protein
MRTGSKMPGTTPAPPYASCPSPDKAPCTQSLSLKLVQKMPGRPMSLRYRLLRKNSPAMGDFKNWLYDTYRLSSHFPPKMPPVTRCIPMNSVWRGGYSSAAIEPDRIILRWLRSSFRRCSEHKIDDNARSRRSQIERLDRLQTWRDSNPRYQKA